MKAVKLSSVFVVASGDLRLLKTEKDALDHVPLRCMGSSGHSAFFADQGIVSDLFDQRYGAVAATPRQENEPDEIA